nr:hypothetical protein Iba_chr06aCG13890 [Ipomoea batatas]
MVIVTLPPWTRPAVAARGPTVNATVIGSDVHVLHVPEKMNRLLHLSSPVEKMNRVCSSSPRTREDEQIGDVRDSIRFSSGEDSGEDEHISSLFVHSS